MRFHLKEVLIGLFLFDFFLILIVSLFDNKYSFATLNLTSYLNISNILNKGESIIPIINPSGFFKIFIEIYNAIVSVPRYFLGILFVFFDIIELIGIIFYYFLSQLLYVVKVLPVFLGTIFIITSTFIVVVSLIFSIEIFSSRLSD